MSVIWSELRIDKSSPVPLYYQLKQELSELIRSGRLKLGERTPTEMELCKQLSLSRPTVRQALSELVNEGKLLRRRGLGTVVSEPKVDAQFLNRLQSYDEAMRDKGFTPATTVLAQERVAAIPQVNEGLRLLPQEALIHLRRLRLANGEPLVYLDTYLPERRCQTLADVDFTKESLYAQLESRLGLRVSRVVRQMEARCALRADAELLQIAVGSALFEITTIGYTADGLPVEYSVARYRGDRNSFTVELYR